MAHLYKNQLQIYAQKKNINLPVYSSEREGPPHACRFKSKVMLEGKTYECSEFFSTVKDAENAAAKAALMSVSSNETEEEDTGFFKNLLQELAQKEYSCLPSYATTRSGPSHNPIFSSKVEINEESFTGQEAKTKKLAEMNAAKVAYIAMKERKGKPNFKPVSPYYHVNDAPPKSQFIPIAELSDKHITAADPISNTAHMDLVSCNEGLDDLNGHNEVFIYCPKDNGEWTKRNPDLTDMTHLYKNQLQIYAQKKNINLPVYISEREGPPHACRFKSKVMLEGKTYECSEFFSTSKDAENAAAKAALMSVSSNETEEEDPGFFKNLLQELAQKEHSCLPTYATTRSGPSHNPVFSSKVEINEESFTGQEAKTKKLAEMNAAKVAYIAMKERKGKPNFKPVSPYYHVNDAPPKSQFIPIAESSDKHITASDPISNTVHMDLVSCNKGLDDLNDQNEVIIYCPKDNGEWTKRNPDLTGAYHQDTVAQQIGGKPEVHNDFDLNNPGLKLDTSSGEKSSSAPIQSPSTSGVRQNVTDASSASKRIKVFPVTPNMTIPEGATVMHRDERWIAVSMDTIHGNV